MIAHSGSARLAFDVEGGGDGADVLFLHAGVTDRRSWRPVIEQLAPRHRCVSFDARGYGETTAGPEPFSRVDDALAVLDAAGLERVVIVAASMGGKAATALTLQHPERVAGLVLIGAAVDDAPEPDELPDDIATLWPLMQAAEEAGDWAEVNRLEAWIWLDGPTVAEGRVGGAVRDLFLDMNAISLAAPHADDIGGLESAWERLPEIAVPTLVLVGELDLSFIRANNAAMSVAIPDARLVRLPGVAHLPHLEADPVCLREITAFVDTFGGRTPRFGWTPT